MWTYAVPAPGRLERRTIDPPTESDLRPGQFLARFLAGGICGSDAPKFGGLRPTAEPENGTPLHEICAEVVASKHPHLTAGMRVVGMVTGSRGFSEYFVNDGDLVFEVGDDFTDVQATMIQPVSTVMSALSALPDLRGQTVAVIGQGPLGILFSHIAKVRGAARVTGVDVVYRGDLAEIFGVDDPVHARSEVWADHLAEPDRPSICIEAVGHQQRTLTDAITAVAHGGTVYGYGVPDEPVYAIPFERLFRKSVTLVAGVTSDYQTFLPMARDYIRSHPAVAKAYLSKVYPVRDAQSAFEEYSRPSVGRMKVVLVAD